MNRIPENTSPDSSSSAEDTGGASTPGGPIGLIPAAGYALRLPDLGGSKEVAPILGTGEPAIGFALKAMAKAGVRDVVIVLRPEKQDIREVLRDGRSWGVRTHYIETGPTQGPAETIDKAYDQVRGKEVALAFPDILMETDDPYTPLLGSLRAGKAQGVLGLFPRSPHQAADPVLMTSEGAVTAVLPKAALPKGERTPQAADWCWGTAVWSSELTEFIHRRIAKGIDLQADADWSLGQLLTDALAAGVPIAALPVADAPFLDIGTPEGLYWANQGRQSPPPI
ncbi:MAG: nucleotidyltransferase family protein [Longimicrobiales bacterium]